MRNTVFAAELHRRMKALRINQAELSRRSRVPASSISFYLSSSRLPDRSSVEKLAPVLGWPLDSALKAAADIYDVETSLRSAPNVPSEVEEIMSAVRARMAEIDADDRAVLRSLLLDLADSFVRARSEKQTQKLLLSGSFPPNRSYRHAVAPAPAPN